MEYLLLSLKILYYIFKKIASIILDGVVCVIYKNTDLST